MEEQIALAAQEYLNRQARKTHPEGKKDRAGRWYPSEQEHQACCSAIRSPSRSWPWSLMTHCRTAAHVAELYQVPVGELRRVVRKLQVSR